MVYQPHALLRFGGRWYDTEQWSCGLRLITDDNDTTVAAWEEACVDLVEDLAPMVAAWIGRSDSTVSTKAKLDKVSCNSIGPNGLYSDPGNPHDFFYASGSAPTGTSPTNTWPQLAVCVSLRTAVTRGYATHGRVYTPASCTAGTTGRIPTVQRDAIANSFRDLIEDINTEDRLMIGGNIRVGVVSDMGDPGAARIVTNVMCGDVIDTQRRRRNALVESYYSTPVVNS